MFVLVDGGLLFVFRTCFFFFSIIIIFIISVCLIFFVVSLFCCLLPADQSVEYFYMFSFFFCFFRFVLCFFCLLGRAHRRPGKHGGGQDRDTVRLPVRRAGGRLEAGDASRGHQLQAPP